jgi:hypothetical protein
LVIQVANYPDWLGPLDKFVNNPTKLTCLEITGYQIKYSTVLWHLELQMRHGQNVQTQLHAVGAEIQVAIVAYFQRKIQLSGFSAYPDGPVIPINLEKWGSTVVS